MARLFRRLVAGLILASLTQGSWALDPARSLSQYVHSEWGKNKGFVGGTIYAICQSGDGYLWLGTDRGLVRFDGEKFTLIQQPLPDQPAIGPVRGLAEDSDGSLWIRPEGPQLLLYRDGQFRSAFAGGDLPQSIITAMAADGHGGVLFSELASRSVRYAHGGFETVTDSTEGAGTVTSLAETRDGRIWLGTRDSGLLLITNGKSEHSTAPGLGNDKINALAAANNGGLWIGTDQGLRFRSTRGDIRIALPESNDHTQIIGLAEDVAGNTWAASSRGLVRITPGGDFSLLPGSGRKTAEVTAVFEDNDGNLWFGGPGGLEQLKDGLFTTYTPRAGLPDSNGGALHVDAEGRIWFAPVSGGLYCLERGRLERIRLEGLDRDVVYSISGRGNDIWVGRQRGGLTRITRNGRDLSARTYTLADGLAQNTVYTTYVARDGAVWAGTVSGGLSRLKNGVFTTWSVSNGLSSNYVNSVLEGYDGTIWVCTSAGLNALRNGRWSHWSTGDGLPSSDLRNCFEDSKHVLWIVTASGLAYVANGRVGIPSHPPDQLRDQIFGIAEDGLGYLWFSTMDSVVRVNRDRLIGGSPRDSDVQVLGEPDGLRGAEGVRRDRSILADAEGRIWVSVQDGIACADPQMILRQARPIRVRIEWITAGGTAFRPGDPVRIPARTRTVTFHFSEATLESPDRIWFRYRLEGTDQDWSEPIQGRQVSYSNLEARPYRFRVMASSEGTLWNGPESDAPFTIDQAYWQMWWFRTMSVFAVALTVLLLFQLRTIRLSRQLSARFQERLAERTRIAQELHDTLLQSFQGLMLRFQTVGKMLPTRPHEAKTMLDDALDRADDALAESREAIQNIRSFPTQQPRLTRALALLLEQVQNEFLEDERKQPSCSLVIEGSEQTLPENVTAEVCRIAREALRNAFQHAQASHLEIEVSFRDIELRLSFRDDGAGIDPLVLKDGARSGHWGLIGLRERATRLGAELAFWSKPGVGTEIALTIPGHLAYTSSRPNIFRRIHNRMKA